MPDSIVNRNREREGRTSRTGYHLQGTGILLPGEEEYLAIEQRGEVPESPRMKQLLGLSRSVDSNEHLQQLHGVAPPDHKVKILKSLSD